MSKENKADERLRLAAYAVCSAPYVQLIPAASQLGLLEGKPEDMSASQLAVRLGTKAREQGKLLEFAALIDPSFAQAAPVADAPGSGDAERKAKTQSVLNGCKESLDQAARGEVRDFKEAMADAGLMPSQPPQSVKEIVVKIEDIVLAFSSTSDLEEERQKMESLIESHVQERLREETERAERLRKALEQAIARGGLKLSDMGSYVISAAPPGQMPGEDVPELFTYLRSTPDSKGDV